MRSLGEVTASLQAGGWKFHASRRFLPGSTLIEAAEAARLAEHRADRLLVTRSGGEKLALTSPDDLYALDVISGTSDARDAQLPWVASALRHVVSGGPPDSPGRSPLEIYQQTRDQGVTSDLMLFRRDGFDWQGVVVTNMQEFVAMGALLAAHPEAQAGSLHEAVQKLRSVPEHQQKDFLRLLRGGRWAQQAEEGLALLPTDPARREAALQLSDALGALRTDMDYVVDGAIQQGQLVAEPARMAFCIALAGRGPKGPTLEAARGLYRLIRGCDPRVMERLEQMRPLLGGFEADQTWQGDRQGFRVAVERHPRGPGEMRTSFALPAGDLRNAALSVDLSDYFSSHYTGNYDVKRMLVEDGRERALQSDSPRFTSTQERHPLSSGTRAVTLKLRLEGSHPGQDGDREGFWVKGIKVQGVGPTGKPEEVDYRQFVDGMRQQLLEVVSRTPPEEALQILDRIQSSSPEERSLLVPRLHLLQQVRPSGQSRVQEDEHRVLVGSVAVRKRSATT